MEEENAIVRAIAEGLIEAHDFQLEKFGGAPGLRDRNLLESAVGRAMNLVCFDPSKDIVDMACCMAHGVMKNHPFVDGNKRTAFACVEAILRKFGLAIAASDDVLVEGFVYFASRCDDPQEMSDWVREKLVYDDTFDFSLLETEDPAEDARSAFCQ